MAKAAGWGPVGVLLAVMFGVTALAAERLRDMRTDINDLRNEIIRLERNAIEAERRRFRDNP